VPLTKTNFINYLDCPLHMWLKANSDVQPKELPIYDLHIAKQGYQVERIAKQMLKEKVAREYPAGTTVSFEVTLTDGNYQSRIDALVHDRVHNTYDLYEIKSSTSIKSKHKYDVTFQYLIAKATLPINKVYLVHVNTDYVKNGDLDIHGFFVIEDIMAEIAKKEDQVYELRSDAWSVLGLTTMPTDEHCFNPKTCMYPQVCFPDLRDFPIYDLKSGSKRQYRELLDMGITRLEDIPDTYYLTHKQKLQLQSARQGKPVINYEGVKNKLSQLQYPLYFLDYETYGEAIPMYEGYGPYQQAVTQYSIHVVRHPDSDAFEHFEYLATEAEDPACKLAEALCSVIGSEGSVIVWNMSFECGRNDELAALCPQFAQQLRSINERTFDLMTVFSEGWYVDYKFHGSASIKKVLPVLCPDLSYGELEIAEGATAMLKWYEMVYRKVGFIEKEKITKDLLKYCELDTWAMVEIWRVVNHLDTNKNF
jgi:hypothetical protein